MDGQAGWGFAVGVIAVASVAIIIAIGFLLRIGWNLAG
jgi:tetrahydromethanopterin S-methyltransferase subunit B